jgi:hypothetical protein
MERMFVRAFARTAIGGRQGGGPAAALRVLHPVWVRPAMNIAAVTSLVLIHDADRC